MSKYQGLQSLAGGITAIGWIAVVIGSLALVVSLVSLLASSNSVFALSALFGLVGGGQIVLFGLLLAAAGGVINVIIDIEANTSGRIQQISSPQAATSPTEEASSQRSDATPLPVPPGYVQVGRESLPTNVPVFHPLYGEGTVIGFGRDKFFALVHFPNSKTSPTEIEKYGLYRRR